MVSWVGFSFPHMEFDQKLPQESKSDSLIGKATGYSVDEGSIPLMWIMWSNYRKIILYSQSDIIIDTLKSLHLSLKKSVVRRGIFAMDSAVQPSWITCVTAAEVEYFEEYNKKWAE